MREILFRGKRVDNGEWVKGDPAGSIRGAVSKIDYFDGLTDCETVDVIPSTVGQFTGLTDKNGNKIFEGDIIKTKKYGKIVGHSNVNSYDIFVVEYEPAVFRLVNHSRGFNFVGNVTDCEVIGNIHDNPELLEGATQ